MGILWDFNDQQWGYYGILMDLSMNYGNYEDVSGLPHRQLGFSN